MPFTYPLTLTRATAAARSTITSTPTPTSSSELEFTRSGNTCAGMTHHMHGAPLHDIAITNIAC